MRLSSCSDELDSSASESLDVVCWDQPDYLKLCLKKQKHDELTAYFNSDLFHPPIPKMMNMGPTATSHFLQNYQNEVDNWSHHASWKTRILNGSKKKVNSSCKWTIQDFEIGPVLGRGRFATVYLARERIMGYIVALKVLEKSTLTKHQMELYLRTEIEIQAHLKHDNIVQIYGYFHDTDHIYLIMEYVLYGELFKYVKKAPLDEGTAVKYLVQISRALQFMHKNCIVHRDLKLENIYIGESGKIKIADFGWSLHSRKLESDKMVGTLVNMAPEMLTSLTPPSAAASVSTPYNYKIDNWALGIVLYQMLVSAHPFDVLLKNTMEIMKSIQNDGIGIPDSISSDAADLIRGLLERNPQKRMELEEIEEHPWVRKMCGLKEEKKDDRNGMTESSVED